MCGCCGHGRNCTQGLLTERPTVFSKHICRLRAVALLPFLTAHLLSARRGWSRLTTASCCPACFPLGPLEGSSEHLVSKARSLGPGPDRPCALGKVTWVPGAWEGVKWFQGTFLHVEALQRLSQTPGLSSHPRAPRHVHLQPCSSSRDPSPSCCFSLPPLCWSWPLFYPLAVTPSPSQPSSQVWVQSRLSDVICTGNPQTPRPSLNFLSVECREVYRA